jgi:hypothetical protein
MTAGLLLAPVASRADDVTNIPASDRIPRPAVRQDSYRNVLAPELGFSRFRTYLGDLHVHSRGHTFGLVVPNVNRGEVHNAGHLFGFDFLAITNHATSWSDADDDAVIHQYGPGVDSFGNPNYLGMKGSEDYVGPDDVAHSNSFNVPLVFNGSMSSWYQEILGSYDANPASSVHIQLNHPNSTDPYFQLPGPNSAGCQNGIPNLPGIRCNWSSEEIRKVRDAVELAEYTGMPTYLELLRRGFRVAPASNSDVHARFRQDVGGNDNTDDDIFLQRENGAWVMPYFEEPGVPKELVWDRVWAQGRTGVVLPQTTAFYYNNFLTALRNRRTFRTSHPRASAVFQVNGRTMGDEFTLAANEKRLDFTVWATTMNGHGGGGTEWTKLQVWTPSQPSKPIYEVNFNDPALLDLKHTFSLMAYESVYVIRLEQAMGTDVVMAPVWITNPMPKPSISWAYGVSQITRDGDIPQVSVNGGSGNFLLQRSSQLLAPRNWHTVKAFQYYVTPIGAAQLPRESWWRVVDADQPDVASNTLKLTVTDALSVLMPYRSTPPEDTGSVTVGWMHASPVRAAYYASRDNGWTWTKVGEETDAATSRTWSFNLWEWGNANVTVKVVDANNGNLFGTTTPFYVVRNRNLPLRGLGGKCLDVHWDEPVPNGAKVQMWDCTAGSNQAWTLMPNGEIQGFGGKCLDVHWVEPVPNGAMVQMWECTGASNQKWTLLPNGALQGFGSKCLDVDWIASVPNGTKVQMWDCGGGANQQWQFVRP